MLFDKSTMLRSDYLALSLSFSCFHVTYLQSECHKLHEEANLASIHNFQENEHVASLLEFSDWQSRPYWIGMFRAKGEYLPSNSPVKDASCIGNERQRMVSIHNKFVLKCIHFSHLH